jgi:hypothetical protein
MIRDMDLVRDLLIRICDTALSEEQAITDIKEVYHLKMLSEEGYISGLEFHEYSEGLACYLLDPKLTWNGHEFLETVRPKKIWEKIKTHLKDKGVGLTIDAISKAAPGIISKALGG